MTLIGIARPRTRRCVVGLPCILSALIAIACSQGDVANSGPKATPSSNTPTNAKPAATETKQPETKPAGKEIRVADGPALKSITPPEGAVLAGVLNDIAVNLPKPEVPADAKASGKVTVEIVVNERGVVVASSVVSGPQPLWSAAGAAARKAQFDPPLKDGKPVKVAGVLIFDFEE